jgi:multidrug resistance efflux pump
MHPKRPPVPVIVVLLLAVLVGSYFGLQMLFAEENGALQASGTIETVDISVSPEMAGKVTEVLADEGDIVESGAPLLFLDDSLLAAQRAVAASQLDSAIAGSQAAQSALSTAKYQYQIVLESALEQDRSTRLRDWFSKDPNQFDQPGWYFTQGEQISAAQSKVDLAREELEDARANLAKVSETLEVADFLESEERLLNARLDYLITKDVNNRAQNSVTSDVPVGRYNATHCGTNEGYFVNNARLTNMIYRCTGDEHLSDASQLLYDVAKDELESAQKSYNDLLTTETADKVLQARAGVSVAQERYHTALDFLRALQTGAQSTGVAAAEGAMNQAQSTADQAQKAVEQAQANLELIDTQIAKLIVFAPADGTILTRNVEPGEFVQPGATVFTLANLDDLTITVYVPEDRYGEISLGQQAEVRVDSFSGETFSAQVTFIADTAEYTPRNVQTVEGRSATVYAVRLKVDDPGGKLKPGMPADVNFSE